MKTASKTLLLVAATGLLYSLPATAQSKVDFIKDIQPILQKSCVQCHGPEKQKGKLRLDSKEGALKNAEVLVPGKADKSDMYHRITLAKGHDDIMPPEGDPLTKAQTDLIRDWINQGADWPAGTLTAAKPAETKAELPPVKATPAELKAVAELEKLGVDIRVIAQNVGWREANYRALGDKATDATLAPLKNMQTIYELNLAGTKISNAGLANIAGLAGLQRLHLEKTAITDAGLAQLKNLTGLTYLNLYNTGVTDAGLENLKGLKNLKNLYVFETKVTEAGAKKLQAALPGVNIDRGWDISALPVTPPPAPKAEEKKDEKKTEPAPAAKKKKKKAN